MHVFTKNIKGENKYKKLEFRHFVKYKHDHIFIGIIMHVTTLYESLEIEQENNDENCVAQTHMDHSTVVTSFGAARRRISYCRRTKTTNTRMSRKNSRKKSGRGGKNHRMGAI